MRTARSVIAAALTSAAVLSTALASCSDDEPNAPTDGGDEIYYAPKKDTGAPTLDASPDTNEPKPPPPVLPGCVGSSIPLTIAGERAYVSLRIGTTQVATADAGASDADVDADASAQVDAQPSAPDAAVGDFVIDYGTTGSTIDFAAFPSPPIPSFCYGDASVPGADCTFQGFDFFGDWGQVWLRTADYSGIQSLIRQAGILATDFLSLYPHTIDYARGAMHRADPKSFCTDAQLLGSGFMPLNSDGFFTTDLSKLRPLSDVIDDPDGGQTTNFVVPNVPTVPIAIAGVSALAQLDTGYDDRLIRHSINVNEALFAIIAKEQEGQQRKIERDELADVYLTTCIPGYNERVLAYRLASGQSFDFIAQGGSVARRENTIAIFVKQRSEETAKCGGISTWTVPAAQIGSSFFIDAQAMIFDPASSRVWIPKK